MSRRGRPAGEKVSRPSGADVARLVSAAAARRVPPPGTTAFRLVNAEGDGLPGVTVDWFDGVAVLALYRDAGPAEEAALAQALVAAGARAVYLKRRPREARVVAGTQKAALAPEAPLRGEGVSEFEVQEHGLRFLIRPGQGLSVGLYLDAREVRQWVRGHAHGCTVLNCFAYTCGFGVAAAAGGAARVVNVDVSRRVLDWGAENAQRNGLGVAGAERPSPSRGGGQAPALRIEFVAGDAFEQFARFARRGEGFDLVVLDPPSFASTKKSRFSAASDYPRLAAAAARVVAPRGRLLACCNLAGLSREKFEAMVLRGVAEAGRAGKVTERLAAPASDFPAAPGTGAQLKGAVVALD